MARAIRVEGDLAYVPLTQGHEAIIDAADAALVGGVNWTALVSRRNDGSIANVYAHRLVTERDGKRRPVYMHRLIAGTPDGLDTDHINGNGIDNRRSNLRAVNRSQNTCNSRARQNNSSGAKGVWWSKTVGKWQAGITVAGKSFHLGYHEDVTAASAAYAKASAELHGEFGRVA